VLSALVIYDLAAIVAGKFRNSSGLNAPAVLLGPNFL
jgi:hypothetical protein